MSRREILEYMPGTCEILSEGKDKQGSDTLRAKVLWQAAGVINGNKRRYRKEILEREIKRLTPKIAEGEVWGCSYHPEDGVGRVQDISHQWQKVWLDEKTGECFGELEVLGTSAGKDLQVLLRKGKIGMSSRGRGTLTKMTEKINGVEETFDDVNDDYQMLTPGDFVLGPSVENAGVIQILESQLNAENADDETESEEDEAELEEAWQSLRTEIEDAARADFENSYCQDFSDSEAILRVSEKDTKGEVKSMLFKVPYTYDDETELVNLDWANAVECKEKVVYEPEKVREDQQADELRYGQLTEIESRLNPEVKPLGPPKILKLNAGIEERMAGSRVLGLIRKEKFKLEK